MFYITVYIFHPAARIQLELLGEHFWMGRVCNIVHETTEFVLTLDLVAKLLCSKSTDQIRVMMLIKIIQRTQKSYHSVASDVFHCVR